jgi:hypothetical protein
MLDINTTQHREQLTTALQAAGLDATEYGYAVGRGAPFVPERGFVGAEIPVDDPDHRLCIVARVPYVKGRPAGGCEVGVVGWRAYGDDSYDLVEWVPVESIERAVTWFQHLWSQRDGLVASWDDVMAGYEGR